jgi:signal transduction histidine kinase/ligand-binding sensor domain-containing protein/DNA-binding response OmpR family regulator
VKQYFNIFLFITLQIASFTGTDAQNRNFDKILTSEGEANLSVRQIIQDSKGFLWLATFSGLYKYEGEDFIKPFSFVNGEVINSDLTCLLEDNNKYIWIGTNQGLSRYNPVTEELHTYFHDPDVPGSVSSDRIRSLGMDNTGRLWIGTFNAGLNFYNPSEDDFTRVEFDSLNVKSPLYIKTILQAKDGKMWIGTLGDGIYCFRPSGSKTDSVFNYRTENQNHTLSNNFVYSFFEDSEGIIVAGTREGLNILDKTKNSFERIVSPGFSNSNMNDYYRSVIRDRSGKLWIGTWDGLIVSDSFEAIRSGHFELIKHNRNLHHSISYDQILNIFQDRSGVVWVGTENGLNKYDPYQNQFQQLSGEAFDNLKVPTATAFYPYKSGMLILTLTDGILFKNGNQLTPVVENFHSMARNERFYSLLADAENNIWAGSYNGYLVKINSRGKITTYRHSRRNIPIYSVVQGKNDTLMIGTGGEGLKYFNTKTETFQEEKGLPANTLISAVYVDGDFNIWVASQKGIYMKKQDGGEFKNYLPDDPKKDLSPNFFYDIGESKNTGIVVGGRNGLYFYSKETDSFHKRESGNMTSLWVTNIQFDSEQNIWLNLNFNRIACLKNKTGEMRVYNVNNGIRTGEYNRRGFFVDMNNMLYVSGFDQVYQFNTSHLFTNYYSPTPVFTRLIVNNSEIHTGIELNKQVILNSAIEFQDKITLNNRNKDFTISFVSSSYLNNKENKYRYILHGYDNEWRTGPEKSAHYTNLNPGNYVFEVFSINNDGIPSPEPAKLSIRIKPTPFLSFWALFIYIIISAIAIYETRKIILARIQLRRELLIERIKRDKEEKFNQERLRFYTNISHELRTPLTLIMGPIQQLISEEKEGTKHSRLQQLILNNSQRLLTLVNQLLDFRKSLFEGMILKATYSNIVELIELNIQAFDYLAKEKSIVVSFSTEKSEVSGWFDKEKLETILFNILSNAFKYTPNGGYIKIELATEKYSAHFPKKHSEIRITNSGKGIPKHLQEKVFEHFFQIKDDPETLKQGSGIGLSLVKALVELHHGKITVDSDPGKTTTFTILLSLDREEYSEEEVFDFMRDADRRTKELLESSFDKNEKSGIRKSITDSRRILIIEDNRELRYFLTGFLSDEYEVLTAGSGSEGLEICEKDNPDLVISDVMMENMDGLQFCKKLKTTPEISHIPVILMTALASMENKISGYKTGADDYITKPFEPQLLKIRVHSMLENLEKARKAFSSDITISTKDLTISKIDEDFLLEVVDIIEKNIDNVEFDIEYFSKNIGVSTSQLYRKIKGISGLSPNEFIRTYRLKKAARMIRETNLNISEIAYKVGFNDALYFSKCFKKQFGSSPSTFSFDS